MKAITLDTETHLIKPGAIAPKLVSLGTKYDTNDTNLTHAMNNGTREITKEMLNTVGIVLNGQNIPFDFGVLVNYEPSIMPLIFDKYRRGEVWDTRIADKLAHIAAGWMKGRPDGEFPKFSLKDIARRTLGIEVTGKEGEDAWRLRYSELDDVPISEWPGAASEYAINDVEITHKLFNHQVKARKNLATLDLQLKSAWALHLMSCWGLTVDEEAVDNLTKQLKDEVSSEMTEFKRLGLYREKGTKNMAIVKERVEEAYYAMGKDCPCTKTGPSTSKRTLMESGDPVLQRLAEIGATQKLLNTFIPVLNLGMGGGSIHPGYDTLKETGRTSSFKPNIQQLPRKGGIRECFIPRPGYVFIAADYSVAELCSLAQVLLDVFGTSKMADALKQGKDLHINTAASIMNMDYDKCMRLYKEGDPKVEDIRQTSKVLNFGLPGGLGAKGFVGYAAGFGLTVTYGEATRLRSKWLSEYPEMELYFKWISDQMGTGGSFTSTHPITGFMRGNVGYCDGANHQFQHLTATGAKIALFNIANECYVNKGTDLFGCRPVAFIHDEVLMEAPIANAHESALRLTKLMEEGMSEVLKDIHCAAEATMMRRWYKGAKPVYENGRLVPWEPKK